MPPRLSRMDEQPPPGMLPDGTLDVVVEAPEDGGPPSRPPRPEPKPPPPPTKKGE